LKRPGRLVGEDRAAGNQRRAPRKTRGEPVSARLAGPSSGPVGTLAGELAIGLPIAKLAG
jgi:hypothetical protein